MQSDRDWGFPFLRGYLMLRPPVTGVPAQFFYPEGYSLGSNARRKARSICKEKMRIYGFLLTLLMLCVTLSACDQSEPLAPERSQYNVLFIAIDDLRPELGCYGDTPVISPNIDKFASEGLVFNRAYCQVPTCGASRASMLTGIMPTSQRFVLARTRVDEDMPHAATLPQVFKEAGYTTLSNGKVFDNPDDSNSKSWSQPAWRPPGIDQMDNLDPESTRRLSERGRGRIYEYPDVPDNAYADGRIAEKTISDLLRLKKSGEPFFPGLRIQPTSFTVLR